MTTEDRIKRLEQAFLGFAALATGKVPASSQEEFDRFKNDLTAQMNDIGRDAFEQPKVIIQ